MKAFLLPDGRRSSDPPQDSVARGPERHRPHWRGIGARLLVGAVLVGFVVLVTVIFSVVGTITSCALFGMMMGSLRGSKWDAISVSILFPAVTMALLQFPAPAVSLQKAAAMAALCFAIFWVMYFLTRGLMLLEAKDGTVLAPPAAGSAPRAGGEHSRENELRVRKAQLASSPAVGVLPLGSPDLEELQGSWVQEKQPGHGMPWAEVIEFTRERVRLKRADSAGDLQLGWEGSVKCESLGPFKTIRVFDVTTHFLTGSGAPPHDGQTWVYRITARTLTIAAQFESGGNEKPAVGQYRRVEQGSAPFPASSRREPETVHSL